MRTPRLTAIAAASSGSGPVVFWPSLSRTMTAGANLPGAAGVGEGLAGDAGSARPDWASEVGAARGWSWPSASAMASSYTRMPLPMAVERWVVSRSIAVSTALLSVVGACFSTKARAAPLSRLVSRSTHTRRAVLARRVRQRRLA